MIDFNGVKAALIMPNGKLVTILRENKPGVWAAGLWEVPGGGREDNETPFQCIAREVKEELGITIHEASIIWEQTFPAIKDPSRTAYFMVIRITEADVSAIQLGDEGDAWQLMSIDEYLQRDDVIEPLKGRLRAYVATKNQG